MKNSSVLIFERNVSLLLESFFIGGGYYLSSGPSLGQN